MISRILFLRETYLQHQPWNVLHTGDINLWPSYNTDDYNNRDLCIMIQIQIQITKTFIATNTLTYTTYTNRYTATMMVTKQMIICSSMGSEIS